MTPPRRAKLVLLVLAVALVGLGVWAWEPLWMWVMTKTVLVEHLPSVDRVQTLDRAEKWVSYARRGTYSVERWIGGFHGWYRVWFTETGKLACEMYFRHHWPVRRTVWWFDGTVAEQTRPIGVPNESDDSVALETKTEAPWWWNATDQTEPSMPEWMKDDAKWQAALDAQE